MLDDLALDPATASIVLYLESVRHPRSFLSALRAATASKPVVVLKAGRDEGARATASTHSRALVGNDAVFDCAIRRAGAVRVRLFVQLFSAVKCLASRYRPVGRRLAIVSNGGGPAVLASDRAVGSGLELASLSDTTLRKPEAITPGLTARNPVDIGERAGAEAFAATVAEVMADPGVDGVLAMHAPTDDRDPLIADEHGAIVVDARIVLASPEQPGELPCAHMAIMPYPTGLTREQLMRDGTPYRLRAIRPEDADALQGFGRGMSAQTRYFRFVANVKELPPQQLARFTQIDYWREMVLVAEVTEADGSGLAGVALHAESGRAQLRVRDRDRRRPAGPRSWRATDAGADGRCSRAGSAPHGGHGAVRQPQDAGPDAFLGFTALPDPEDAAMMLVERVL